MHKQWVKPTQIPQAIGRLLGGKIIYRKLKLARFGKAISVSFYLQGVPKTFTLKLLAPFYINTADPLEVWEGKGPVLDQTHPYPYMSICQLKGVACVSIVMCQMARILYTIDTNTNPLFQEYGNF